MDNPLPSMVIVISSPFRKITSQTCYTRLSGYGQVIFVRIYQADQWQFAIQKIKDRIPFLPHIGYLSLVSSCFLI
jgi:hypothetical protein